MTRVEAGDDADAALIDRLYGGPDSGGGGDGAGAGDDELDGLRMIRGLIARIRDEAPEVEPPQAVSALLLQAAEAHAPKPAAAAVEPERAGLWVRLRGWFATMAAHPAMAAAATLVVVAGATALWMRSGGEVAEPTHPSARPPAMAAAEPEQELEHAAGRGSAAPAVVAEPAPAPVAPAPEASPLQDRISRDVPSGRSTATVEAGKVGKPAPRKSAGTGASAGDAEDFRGGLAKNDALDADKAPARDRAGESAEGKADQDAPTTTARTGSLGGTTAQEAPPPPPAAPVTEAKRPQKKQKPPEEPTPDAVAVQREQQSGSELAAEYTRQAIVAAKRGNCQTVEQLAVKAKAADAGYYKRSFETQADIKRCRAKAKG